VGVIAIEWRRYQTALSAPGSEWLGLHNRHEQIEWAPDGRGVRCLWEWTSTLHAPRHLPALGQAMYRRALQAHPFRLLDQPLLEASRDAAVDASFVIGHRGLERLPLLLASLKSIAGQAGVRVECIVVEQATNPEIRSALPTWVRYVHTPPPYPDMPYARSWALNVGARLARGRLLILHDNDILVPEDYAQAHLERLDTGYEVINGKRFLFYLDRTRTEAVCAGMPPGQAADGIEQILQNALGGGSLAIGRDAFLAIGGFDEAFVGWGGEDNELWDRALTRKVDPYGHLPLIHLWHPAQAGKRAVNGSGLLTAQLTEERRAIAPQLRIRELSSRRFGRIDALDPAPLPGFRA
jgi:hypothetical protein